MTSQLPIPIVTLPNRNLITVRPRSRHIISPEAHPVLERLWRKRVWRAEQMNVIRHDHISADPPEICRLPRRNDQSLCFVIREQRSSPVRAHGEEDNYRLESTSTVAKCAGFFRSGQYPTFGGVAELRPPFGCDFMLAVSDSLLPTCGCVCR